jgi:endonuclease YncB( thermonuclease family)
LVYEELIKNGYGFAYTSFPFSKKQEFINLEAKAKVEAKGLWGNCKVTDQNGRKQTNSQ